MKYENFNKAHDCLGKLELCLRSLRTVSKEFEAVCNTNANGSGSPTIGNLEKAHALSVLIAASIGNAHDIVRDAHDFSCDHASELFDGGVE